MGCSSHKVIEEKLIPNAPPSIPANGLILISEQSKNCIFKIVNKNAIGTAFLCLIPFPDKLHPLPTLITNNHVLTENDIKIGKIIEFSSNEHNYQIKIDNNRKCYTNKKFDITIIEIKKVDGISINKILEIDEDIFNNNAFQKFANSSVYIMHYPNGMQNEISFGKNKNISIDNVNIEHLCNTLKGSSGGAIMNMINYKAIGIHKGAEKNKNWNLGSLLKLPIEKFYEKFGHKEDNKNDNNNENKKIINNENSDQNNKNNNENNNLEEDKLSDNEFSLFNNDDLQIDNFKNKENKIEKDKIQAIPNANMSGDKKNAHYEDVKKENSNSKENEENKNIKIINNSINNIDNKNNQNINNSNIKNEEIINKQIYIDSLISSQLAINPNLMLNEKANNNIYKDNSNLLKDNNNKINNEINNEENIVDEITIIYSKANIKSNSFFYNLKFKIASTEIFSENKLFGEKFVKNNINNCKIIIYGKEYKLSSFINEEYNENVYFLEIKLKGVSKLINMNNMFCGCISLTALPDIDKLNTKNVIYMSNIFSGCQTLLSLPDISKWNTSKVVTMGHIFQYCLLLESLPDISKWDTSNVKDMTYMFCMCEKLLTLPDISKWDTSKAVSFFSMFNGCKSLKVLPDISKWNTRNVKDMGFMFDSCKNLTSLPDISCWNTSNLEDTRYMFHGCSSINYLPDLTKWNTNNIKETNNMFLGCKSNLNIPKKFQDCLIF